MDQSSEAMMPAARSEPVATVRSRTVGAFAVVCLLATAGLGWLGYTGYHIAQRIRGGTTIDQITDPSAPGYRAAAAATPVHLLVVADDDDVPVDFMLLVEGARGVGGSVVWIVGDLVVDSGKERVTLRRYYADEGVAAVQATLEFILGFAITDVAFAGPGEVSALMEPAGSITVRNPDDLVAVGNAKRETVYPAGELELSPSEVAGYLTFLSDGAAPATRGSQAEAVWGAFFASLAARGDAANESNGAVVTDSGTNLVAATQLMSTGSVQFIVLPVTDEAFGPTRLYTVDTASVAQALKGVVAAPVAAFPGQRPKVEILNGTTDVEAAARVAPEVAAAGAEVVSLGNSRDMEQSVTTVVFHTPELAEAAAPIADLFGVQATLSTDQTDARDITVTLGADLSR